MPVDTSHAASEQLAADELEAARAQRMIVRNRRRRYLDLHPEYFSDASREVAGAYGSPEHCYPLLYDRLVRRFMDAEQREQQGQRRGFADTLEASIVRSEAKLHAVRHPDADEPLVFVKEQNGTMHGIERDERDRAQNKEDGWARWVEHVTARFVEDKDADFDYASVDDNEAYDDHSHHDRGMLEAYLDDESEEHIGDGPATGETGVQDF